MAILVECDLVFVKVAYLKIYWLRNKGSSYCKFQDSPRTVSLKI